MDDAEGLEVPWDFCEAIYALLKAQNRAAKGGKIERGVGIRHIDRGPTSLEGRGSHAQASAVKWRASSYCVRCGEAFVQSTRNEVGGRRFHFGASGLAFMNHRTCGRISLGFESRRRQQWQENMCLRVLRRARPGNDGCSPPRSLARDLTCAGCPMTCCGAGRRTAVAAGMLLTQPQAPGRIGGR